MKPYAYLRKSRVQTNGHSLSWEVQQEAVEGLADRHGHRDALVLLSDWNKSGRGDKTYLRTGYAQLRALVSSGQVSAIYSYSLSRLARSLTEYASLAELCQQHKVIIRLVKEGELDFSSATGRLIVNVLASIAAFEAELAQERAKEVIRIRRARGDTLGRTPYPNMDIVIAAFNEAGSANAAARLLNARAIPSPQNVQWSSATLQRMLRRAGIVRGSTGSVRARGRYLFERLLACPSCGQVLSPHVRMIKGTRYISYFCWRARDQDSTHARPYQVAESRILPLVVKECSHLSVPSSVEMPPNLVERQRLIDERNRVVDMRQQGLISVEETVVRLTPIDDALEQSDLESQALLVPSLDWESTPESINLVLRALFSEIRLGSDWLPSSFTWKVPAFRS